jgi:VanZ family protein
VAFGLAIAVSMVVLFSPQTGVPTAPPGTDKVVHAVLFASLAATGWFAGARRRWLVPGLLAYAVVSELIQASPVLDRQASVADVAADAVGLALGLALARRRTAVGGQGTSRRP